MELIYTNGWKRQEVKTPERYQIWLSRLKDGDTIAVQEFVPASNDGTPGFPPECWRYTIAEVDFDKEPRVKKQDGVRFYLDLKTGCIGYGDVFPARIVPYASEFELYSGKRCTYGHMPVFEPNFVDCYRHVLAAEYSCKSDAREVNQFIEQAFPFSYHVSAERCNVHYCFSKEEIGQHLPQLKHPQIRYCYSQYIED